MSEKSINKKIVCPKCGREISFEIKNDIELPYDILYKHKILKDEMFTLTCESCGFQTNAAYYASYNDMEKRYLIWMMPEFNEADVQKINAYNKRLETDSALKLARIDYKMRVVRMGEELKEKIIIFDEELDDRIIEVMKVSCAKYIRDELKIDNEFQGFFFTKGEKPDEYRFQVLFKDATPISLSISMEQYGEIKKDMGALINERTGKGFNIINANWATKTVSLFLETGKEE